MRARVQLTFIVEFRYRRRSDQLKTKRTTERTQKLLTKHSMLGAKKLRLQSMLKFQILQKQHLSKCHFSPAYERRDIEGRRGKHQSKVKQ